MEIKHGKGRFYIKTEHGEAELLYKDVGKSTISIYHTFTPEADRGHGVAEQMAIAAYEYVKKNKLKVRPDCPYVTHFLEKHSEWQEWTI